MDHNPDIVMRGVPAGNDRHPGVHAYCEHSFDNKSVESRFQGKGKMARFNTVGYSVSFKIAFFIYIVWQFFNPSLSVSAITEPE